MVPLVSIALLLRPDILYRKEDRHKPSRWHGKVLACTDATATPRQVIEWYEVRWQVELFFRELKSRMQFERYVLMKFEAMERYPDLLLLGLLLLEQQRLWDMQCDGDEVGKVWVQARTTAPKPPEIKTILSVSPKKAQRYSWRPAERLSISLSSASRDSLPGIGGPSSTSPSMIVATSTTS